LIEHLLLRRQRASAGSLGGIRLVLCDIDGVLTDAGMYYGEQGDELKKFNTYDGLGIARLREAGIHVGLVTRENRELNARRADKLNVDFLGQSATDKVAVAREWKDQLGLSWEAVAYIGDDAHDVPLLACAGVAAAPASAMPPARKMATVHCARAGGAGCLRELADMILDARNAEEA
jgi:N-acylneuraminate cytidylyltransferase